MSNSVTPVECSPPNSSVHGILQARILEWVALPSSTGSSQHRNQTCISYVTISKGHQTSLVISRSLISQASKILNSIKFSQFSSVTRSCLTLRDLMDHSTPGPPVHHQLPGFTQTHLHWVSDAIQTSQTLLSPSPPAFNHSQHQGLFKWVFTSGGQSIGISVSTSVLPMNTQDWSPLGWTGWISLQSKGLSRVFSNTTV